MYSQNFMAIKAVYDWLTKFQDGTWELEVHLAPMGRLKSKRIESILNL